MKPRKLKQEQVETVQKANKNKTLFTFNYTNAFYYVINNIFRDSKKKKLVYFDEQESKLVYIEEDMRNTEDVQKWIKRYNKGKKK